MRVEEREGCVLQQALMVVNQCGVQHIDGASGEMLRAVVHAGHFLHFLSTVPVEGGKSEFLRNRKSHRAQERQMLRQADYDIDFVIAHPRTKHAL